MSCKFTFCKRFCFLFLFILCVPRLFAQPFIKSFEPRSGMIGSSVTIEGSGFSSNVGVNTVLFGTIKATVTAASTGSLTVTVPNGAVYGPITVINQRLAATSSTSFSITFPGCPGLNTESFLPKTDFALGTNPVSSYAGDIDMDGKPDLMFINSFAATVSVLRNNSVNGVLSFEPGVNIITNYYYDSQSLIMADLDGDAKPEMIVFDKYSSLISIFKNQSTPGVISFAARSNIQVPHVMNDFAVCDVDGDGKTDVVVASSDSHTISILRNTSSDNTISLAHGVDFTTGSVRPVKLSAGDLDQDGKPDLTVASLSYYNDSIAVLKNTSTKGAISFNTRISFNNNGGAKALSIADMDGDHLPDLIVTNALYNKISILKNSSAAGAIDFKPAVDISIADGDVRSLTIGDLDGDSKPDLIIANTPYDVISIFINNSTADNILFDNKMDYAAESYSVDVAIADFDLNGKPDLSVANMFNSISVYLKIASQKIFLVDSSHTANTTATGLCSVSSTDWTNAGSNLQAALNAAQPGDQIWVSKGTYFPTEDSLGNTNPADASTRTFVIKSGVKVYGSFRGTETSLAERSDSLHGTILSGKLHINGGITKANNVVWFSQVQNNTLLNGFTIEGGAAINNAYSGGGVYMNASSPVISNCVIKDNSSKSLGGAVYLNNSNPTFINCSIYNNSAKNGGAIATNNSAPDIINCTIVKNTASDSGGGVYVQSGWPNAINSIIWGNTSAKGIHDNVVSTVGTLIATYSIIGQEKDVYYGTGNRNVNPLFADGTNNDFNLISSSWAITGGNAALYPSKAPATDLNGNPRVNNTISMGAFQGGKQPVLNSAGIIYVNHKQQSLFANGSSWTLAYGNLSDALAVLNNTSASEIWVAKGKYHPATDAGGNPSPSMLSNLSFGIKRGRIYGGFAGNELNRNQRVIANNETILDGLDSNSYTYPFNVYSVVSVLDAYSDVTLDGFTITNGVGYYQSYGGGAIAVQSSKVNVNACKILNNTGAGIYSRYANLTITNCYFSGNSGQYGGAISNNEGTTVISDCDFMGNVPVYGNNYAYGGAIANAASTVSIMHCNFEGNRSVGAGGAIYNDDNSNVTVSNCKFTGNQTSEGGNGGAIANYTSSIALENCTFTRNFAQSGGAVDNRSSSTLASINCTFTNNRAYYYGGILNGSSSTAKLSNSIVWGNTSVYDKRGDNLFNYDSNGPLGSFTVDRSLIGYGTDIYPGIGNINADPKFADTANADIRLLPGSPAIDAGADNAYTGNLHTDFDVNGAARWKGSSIDMGATEYSSTILPVTWLNFSVQQQNNNAVLTWKVTNQVNNQYFEIQVVDDGSNFHVIGKVPAAASNTYSFTDINFSRLAGAYAYYRIKQVDKDGKFTYSEIKRLQLAPKDFVFSLVENPVKGNEVKINIQSADNNKGVVRILDINGKQVVTRNITWMSGNSQQSISTPYLSGGTYLICLTTTHGQHRVKFVK